jgi:capsular polysaccharide biosynthesis protein
MEIPLPVNFGTDFEPVLFQRRSSFRERLPVTSYERCFVTHTGLGLKRFRLIRESTYNNVPLRLRHHFYRYAVHGYFSEPRIAFSEPNLLQLHSHWGFGYHHWLADCLIKIKEIDPRRFVVMLPDDYPPFARQSLRMFPFAGVVALPAGHGVAARRLTFVGNPHVSRFNPAYIRWLSAHLKPHASLADACERLYVTRQQAARRRVENEDAVVALLQRYGFTAIDSAQLEFRTEVGLFSRCRILVGLHGAGLTNSIFMPSDGKVLELYPAGGRSGRMNTTYWHLCGAAGIRYYYQFCRPSRNQGDRPEDADVVVDLARLEHNVRMMVSGSR